MDGRAPPGASTFRELLATRVLSVDAYWQELCDVRGRPNRDREIPVPLWPGESLLQYEREFARWLSTRRLSLSAMREDPVAERNFRLQYAQTRVTRPIEAKRPPPRSPSRLVSSPRRYAGVQHRQQQRYNSVSRKEDDRRSYSVEKRPSLDNRHPFVTRQSGDGQRQDRRYSRERPQLVRHAPGAPQAYDDWQPPRGAEQRPRQDPRVPPPRDAQRQYTTDGQYWSKSPSRSPQYGRATSPSRSDRSSLHRSASPQQSFTQGRANSASLRGQLLARRVISVDAFRDEMYKLRNGFIREDDIKRPHETMVRIPVILWPGETMAQYTQKFERWLDSRNISLPSLRDSPARERSLWHSFAYTRAGTSALGSEQARLKAKSRSPPTRQSHSRSRSRSPSRSTRRSHERSRAGYDKPKEIPSNAAPGDRPHFRESDQGRRSPSPPPLIAPPENPRLLTNKTRRQLLERRIISLDIFQKEVEQNAGAGCAEMTDDNGLMAIPVPLYPGESLGLYDHRFWTWLKEYDETKDSLRGNPSRERRLRITFAYLRVNRPQDATTGSGRSAKTQKSQDSRQTIESHAKLPMDVLKSARDRLVLNVKRHADAMERKTQPVREVHESKRPRVKVECGESIHASANVPPNHHGRGPQQSGTAALPTPPPTQYLSRSSVASTRPSPSKFVPTSVPSTASFAGARSVGAPTSSQASPASASLPPAGSARNSSSARTTQADVFGKVQPTHTISPVQRTQMLPTGRSASASMQASTLRSHDTQGQTAAAVSKKITVSTPVAPHSSMTPMQTVATTSQTAAGNANRADLYTGVYSSATAVRHTEGNPVDMDAAAENRTTLAKPVQAAPHSVPVSWNRSASRLVMSTAVPNPAASSTAATPATSTIARSPTPPATVAATSVPTVTSSRLSLIKIAPVNVATINTNSDIVRSASGNTDAAVFEPETPPAESHEVSDAGSNSADGSEEHDGDVMNPDGCCCTKCMRTWAKTLTDRMNTLEHNVIDLKNEVVNPGSFQSW